MARTRCCCHDLSTRTCVGHGKNGQSRLIVGFHIHYSLPLSSSLDELGVRFILGSWFLICPGRSKFVSLSRWGYRGLPLLGAPERPTCLGIPGRAASWQTTHGRRRFRSLCIHMLWLASHESGKQKHMAVCTNAECWFFPGMATTNECRRLSPLFTFELAGAPWHVFGDHRSHVHI